MIEDFDHIKNPENTQHYFLKNKAFTFSISVSLILHIVLLTITMYSNKTCTECKDNVQDEIRPKIKAYLLKQAPAKEIIDEKIETIVTTQSDKVETAVVALSEELKAKPKQKTVVKKQIQATTNSLEGKLNYSKLRSSINNVIEQDTQIIKQAIFDDCETVKKKSGNLDCVSNIERLGYKQNDPYRLTNIFKSLVKKPYNKERLLAKLKLNKKYIMTVLNNNELPTTMREEFKEEISFIRGEVHYQDCDGKPNSGTCAGEIDLGKIGELLGLLFDN